MTDGGIVVGHAYSILSVAEIDGHRLLKLRNPWGAGVEWGGAWSDGAPEWTPRLRRRLCYAPADGDGVFWIEWSDFLCAYSTLYSCRLFSRDCIHSQNGAWDGTTGGGAFWGSTWISNSRFRLCRTDGSTRPTSVYITLLHHAPDGADAGPRHNRAADHSVAVAFDVFADGDETWRKWGPRDRVRCDALRRGGSGPYATRLQVSSPLTLQHEGPSGWVIVPSASKPADRAAFLLSVYTSEPVRLTRMDA